MSKVASGTISQTDAVRSPDRRSRTISAQHAARITSASVTGQEEQAIANGSTTPSALAGTDFGSVAFAAAPVDETYTIADNGNGPLTIATLSVPEGFTVATAPAGSVA